LKAVAGEDAVWSPGLAWPVGDFYVPGFSSDGRTGWVPGAPDTHRRLFLIRAAELQPELLATLRNVSVDDEKALSLVGRELAPGRSMVPAAGARDPTLVGCSSRGEGLGI
jgi:hypothetical protein